MSTPTDVYVEGMRKALQLAEPGGQLEREILDGGFRPLLAERDTLKSALGNSEKLYTAVCDELAALKAENTRLREALRHIAALWPEPPNCADVLAVNGINDGKGRAILLQAALDLSRAALAAGKGETR